ncbi:2'-5' RNA ligase family protein [Stutzerimonas kunmingensis]|uniref:2'-5' RNA ligase family protein n=1 Tax=Stutzerimonas kunmingensis TaxID=1211807 RepID=UPI001F24843D|nr:2'-5' RNA ligase family protein [Stutzerimonas kunmingensis]UIP32098.1 hypothetical protein LW136_18525 [Stutzerimonas kunmingensis]
MIDNTLRLFFALPCPPEQAAAVCAWREDQALDGRAVSRDNLHLTLAFLGAQPREHLDALLQMAATVHAEAFSLTLDRLTTIGKGFICLQPASPHFSQPCALGRFDGRRSSQVAQAADSADFGQAPASALEQGACGRVDGV